ncbi:MAG: hypothetical protein JST73_04415 [Actinobacteria bacterium]|nr:hypothetical protein [Actinomycetota bacterium]
MIMAAGCSSHSGGGASEGSAPTTAKSMPARTVARPSGPSKSCDTKPAAKAGTSNESLVSDGVSRAYQLVIPDDYDGTKPYALVFALHSLSVPNTVVFAASGFAAMESSYRFITVSPGAPPDAKTPYWNAAPVADNYDVTFLTALLDHLERTLCIDTGRVASIGMSNGAQMSSLLACRIGDRLRGIGLISGVEYNRPCDSPPVPVIAFHGAKDPIVPYAGGGLNSVTIANQNYYHGKLPAGTPKPPGVDASMRGWASHNGCAATPTETDVAANVVHRTWKDCRAATELYVVTDGGHAWPGMCFPGMEQTLGACTQNIDATKVMFAFIFGKPDR